MNSIGTIYSPLWIFFNVKCEIIQYLLITCVWKLFHQRPGMVNWNEVNLPRIWLQKMNLKFAMLIVKNPNIFDFFNTTVEYFAWFLKQNQLKSFVFVNKWTLKISGLAHLPSLLGNGLFSWKIKKVPELFCKSAANSKLFLGHNRSLFEVFV